MGRGHGGTGGSSPRSYDGYSSAQARDLANKYLGDVSNPALKRELADGLAAFENEFGIPERVTVTVRDLGGAVYGQIYTKSGRIEINSRYEDGRLDISHAKHTMIHELAHSIDKTLDRTIQRVNGRWQRKVKPENKEFDKQLRGAYKTFKFNYGNEATKQIGGYALTDKNEFFADAIATHMTGTKNGYTTVAFNLAKSMTGK